MPASDSGGRETAKAQQEFAGMARSYSAPTGAPVELVSSYRFSIASYSRAAGPVYNCRGLLIRPSGLAIISRQCAAQPT